MSTVPEEVRRMDGYLEGRDTFGCELLHWESNLGFFATIVCTLNY